MFIANPPEAPNASEVYANVKTRNRKLTIDRIQTFMGQSRPSRNARLALLDYSAKNSPAGQSVPGHSDLLSACKHYFETFATKTCCFDDTRCYVEILEPSQRRGYLEHIVQFVKKMESEYPSDEVSVTNLWCHTVCLYDLRNPKLHQLRRQSIF
jgi:hypothetical protein